MPTSHAFQAPSESVQLNVKTSTEKGFQLNSSFKSYMYAVLSRPAGLEAWATYGIRSKLVEKGKRIILQCKWTEVSHLLDFIRVGWIGSGLPDRLQPRTGATPMSNTHPRLRSYTAKHGRRDRILPYFYVIPGSVLRLHSSMSFTERYNHFRAHRKAFGIATIVADWHGRKLTDGKSNSEERDWHSLDQRVQVPCHCRIILSQRSRSLASRFDRLLKGVGRARLHVERRDSIVSSLGQSRTYHRHPHRTADHSGQIFEQSNWKNHTICTHSHIYFRSSLAWSPLMYSLLATWWNSVRIASIVWSFV